MIQDIEPHHLENHYDPSKQLTEQSVILVFRGREALVRCSGDKVTLLHPADLKDMSLLTHAVYLLTLDQEDFFLIPEANIPAGAAFVLPGQNASASKRSGAPLKDAQNASAAQGSCTPSAQVQGASARKGTASGAPFSHGQDTSALLQEQTGGKAAESGAAAEERLKACFPDDCRFVRLSSLRRNPAVPQEIYFTLATCAQLAAWYQDNRFCGTCGAPTVHSRTERALVCPNCGRTIYPRIQPAVIVGVTNGDNLLITRYSDRPLNVDALVAGFTEIGETLEQTVEREVMEEVGLRVKNIRYYKSQPWAVADDELAGFYCDVDGDATVHVDHSELKTAVWVKRADIVGQPDSMTLTNEMMVTFREGKEPGV